MIKTNFLILFLLSSIFSFAQTYIGDQANQLIEGSKKVKVNSKNGNIEYFEFSTQSLKSQTVTEQFLKTKVGLIQNYEFKSIKSFKDPLKNQHIKYQLYYNQVEVEGMWYTVHYENGRPQSANGNIVKIANVPTQKTINESEAINIAMQALPAKEYRWDNDKSLYPKAEIMYIPMDSTLKLCYKVDIYALQPLQREFIYVDATNGKIVKRLERIHDINKTGTANTLYSGSVSITTDSISGVFYLKETSRGNGINTYNLNYSSNYSLATEFIDLDNVWDSVSDRAAYDAHYGSELTYDFFYNTFSRNSIDDNGYAINSYVHFGTNTSNAFWDGEKMTYGDGNGSNMSAFTCVDIVAHEITHGLTSYTANLEYEYESGALNESFSDIFGVSVDFYANPDSANYIIGEQIFNNSSYIRNMKDPNSHGDPDTYMGSFYETGSSDNGGVHTNSSIQNYWYYLLCEGGSGVNDNGKYYSVSAIGMEAACAITYRNLTVYLSQYSQFSDARFYSIQSAIDLYGECSPEVIAVTNAWYAVGVGDEFNSMISSAFTADNTYSCSSPATINFTSQSVNATGFEWFVNDVSVSTEENPALSFDSVGDYSIKLIVTGSSQCSNEPDTTEVENYISISNAGSPVSSSSTPSSIYGGTGGVYNFSFAGINQASSGAEEGYMDYSCQTKAHVIEGKKYPVKITTGQSNQEFVAIWIDLNNDGIFTSNEKVFTSSAYTLHEGDIIIPETSVFNTPLRLRVGSDKINYASNIESMGNSYYGQYEDYSIFIENNTEAPKACFSMSDTIINVNGNISFFDESLNIPTQWLWSFNEGTPASSTSKNPSVTFNTVGEHQISLVAENSYGSDTCTQNIHVINEYIMGTHTSSDALNGSISDSGGKNGNYSNNENYSFLISSSCAKEITLTIDVLNTESCCDYLQVYDGTDNSSTLLGTYKDFISSPIVVSSTSGNMFLVFQSDGSVTGSGFTASWTTTLLGGGSDVIADFITPENDIPFNYDFQLIDNSLNDPISWLWNSGDGTISNDQNPIFRYLTSGSYDIELIANNCHATDTIVKQVTVETAPELSVVNDTITFNLISGDSIHTYLPVSNLNGGTLAFTGKVLETYKADLEAQVNNQLINKIIGYTSTSKSGNFVYANTPAITDSETPGIIGQKQRSYQITDDFNGLNFGLNINEYNYTELINLITSNGGNFVIMNYNTSPAILDSIDVLIIDDDYYEIADTSTTRNWISNGGFLIIQGDYTLYGYNKLLHNTGILFHTSNVLYGNANIAEHEVTNGIDSYSIGSSAGASLIISDKATPLLYDYSKNVHCAVTDFGQGNIMAITDESFNSGYLSETGHTQLFKNAIKWGVTNSKNGDWLSVENNYRFVDASASDSLKYQINSIGLIEGTYIGDIQLTSNDINAESVTIPIKLNVTGIENIEPTVDSLWFSKVFVNKTDSVTFSIKNSGTADLQISSITSGTSEFEPIYSPMIIAPGKSGQVNVIFRPLTNQIYRDTLEILSSDPDSSLYRLPVSGNAVNPPVFEVPSEIVQELTTDESVVVPLTISNKTGGSALMVDSILIRNYISNLSILSDTIQDDLSDISVNTPNYNITYFNNLMISNGAYVNTYNLDTTLMNDVLWLNNDNAYYISEKQSEFVDKWIENGGGLFVDASYINTNSALSGLLEKMGVSLEYSYNKTSTYYTSDHVVIKRINPANLFTSVSKNIVTTEGTPLITDSNDNIYALALEYGYGRVIVSNFENIRSLDNADKKLFALNSIKWLANENSWLWVSDYPTDSIQAGEEYDLKLEFDASNRLAGQYMADISVSTNDPLNPDSVVQATLNITGIAKQSFINDTVAFEKVFIGFNSTDSVNIYNPGSTILNVSSITSSNNNFSIVDSSFTLSPRENMWLSIVYEPSAIQNDSGYIVFENNTTDLYDTLFVSGRCVDAPVLTITPDTIHIRLKPGESIAESIHIDNTQGGSELTYEVSIQYGDIENSGSDATELQSVLDSLNTNYTQVTDLIPDKYDFSNGVTGTNISDGGYDMYDNGNYLNTDLQRSISYSDNLITYNSAFGTNGKYFTRKYDGLFVMTADLDQVDQFYISGGLGADGYGSVDGTKLSLQSNGKNYQAFVKRVYGAGSEPSVNHLIIMQQDNNVSHAYDSNTNIDNHTITNLHNVTRIYYLLYASSNGGYIDDNTTTEIADSFLSIINQNGWITPEKWNGEVAAGINENLNFDISSTDLDEGHYVATVKFRSNDPDHSIDSTIVDLDVRNNYKPVLVNPIGNKVIHLTYNEVIDLNTVFNDADNDMLYYTLNSTDNNVVFPELNNGSLLQLHPISTGISTITVRATDNNWDPVSHTFDVLVKENNAPTRNSLMEDVTLNNANPYKVYDLDEYFSDTDGDNLTYSLSTSNNNVVEYEQNGNLLIINRLQNGMVIITVTAIDGKGGSVSDSFIATVKEYSTSIINSDEISDIKLYPNPVQDILNIQFSDNIEVKSIQIVNLSGGTLIQKSGEFKNELPIHVESLSKGVYFIIINTKDGMIQNKFLKE